MAQKILKILSIFFNIISYLGILLIIYLIWTAREFGTGPEGFSALFTSIILSVITAGLFIFATIFHWFTFRFKYILFPVIGLLLALALPFIHAWIFDMGYFNIL